MTDVKSPQLEDGHIRIANELFDAILRAKLKYSTQTVLLVVLRKTYGYGKKEDDVSASQISEMCGISRPHVAVALNELSALNLIHKRDGKYGSIVGVNKDYSSWRVEMTPAPGEGKRSSRTLDAANEKRYHYVYRITDPETEQFYIGVRSCDCLPTQDRYMGSGNWITTLVKRRATKEIVEVFSSREDAEVAEIRYIKSATGKIMNRRRYISTESVQVASTESVHECTESVLECTESAHVQNVTSSGTESVQVASTESVHTKDNLPKDNKQKNPPTPQGGWRDSPGREKRSGDPTPKFMQAWDAYPKRDGPNPRKAAWQAWQARIRSGINEDDLLAAAKRYAAWIDAQRKSGTRFVMQARTFFGPNEMWKEAYGGVVDQNISEGEWWKDAGFSSMYEAENAGCNQWIAHEWHDGKRVGVTA